MTRDTILAVFLNFPDESKERIMRMAFFTCALFCLFRIDDMKNITKSSVVWADDMIKIYLTESKTGPCENVLPKTGSTICPFTIFKKYWDLLPALKDDDCIWRRVNYNKTIGEYYSANEVIGINKMRSWLHEILKSPGVYESLPEDIKWEDKNPGQKANARSSRSPRLGIARYTGHSWRRTGATVLSGIKDIQAMEIQRIGQWKSISTAARYIDNNAASKKRTATKMSDELLKDTVIHKEKKMRTSETSSISFVNCTFTGQVTINTNQ